MKKKYVILLFLTFIVLFSISTGITIAWLTQENVIENNFEMDSIKGTITASGVNDIDTTINSNDLTFIDYKEDFIANKNELLDKLTSEIKISLTAKNNFPTRINIKLPNLTTNFGLLYLIIDETLEESNQEIDIILEQNITDNTYTLKYGYINGANPINYKPLVEGLLLTDTNILFRQKIQETNFNKLKSLYENNLIDKQIEINKNYRILVWGDYESLTQTQKDEFYKQPSNYNMPITIKIIQAIDQYGGTLDYEND